MNIIELLKKHVGKIVAVPVAIVSLNFVLMIVQAMSDGYISDEELHQLLQVGNGAELVLLTVVMAILKLRK